VIVTLDGPAGAGKSTVARRVAELLGAIYLDTGALYRACALQACRLHLKFEDSPLLRRMMSEIQIAFQGKRVFLNGEDVSEAIRSPEVSHYASVISAIPAVREMLLPVQRQAARSGDVVAEGRDVGTVVFPEATFKFFLDASVQERARRRHLELKQKGVQSEIDEVRRELEVRDTRDSSRAASPLCRADDAVYVLTDGMTVEDVIGVIMGRIKGPTRIEA